MLIASCLVAGAMAGLLAGLLGIGGGLLMVPALLAGFSMAGLPADLVPAYALGTSLAGVAFAGTLASREHSKLGNLHRPFSMSMLLPGAFLAIGVACGVQATTHMPGQGVRGALAVYQFVAGAWMLWRSRAAERAPRGAHGPDVRELLAPWSARAFLVFTGAVSAAGGVGGATLLLPWFAARGIDPLRAAALSSYFGAVIGAAGALGYGLLGRPATAMPWSVGFVHLPAFACLAAGAALLAGTGARLSRRVPKAALTRGFALFLIACSASVALPLWRATAATGA